VIYIITFKTI